MHMVQKTGLHVQTGEAQYILLIVGRNQFLNELLTNYLLRESAFRCQRIENDILPVDFAEPSSPRLYLVDASELIFEKHWSEVCGCCNLFDEGHYALFNVDLGSGIEVEAMHKGARGLFYNTDSLEMISKGIRKIMNGDIWFSRETLLNCILQQSRAKSKEKPVSTDSGVNLTLREEEILQYLRQGATNQEIADEMVVSVSTVKSHLYNLYKKIDVPNRFQAMLWATSNLP